MTEILFSHKIEWTSNICYIVDEPWKYDAKWKKPDTKNHILYNSMYMKYPE